jgi:hypothetical protein
MSIFDNPPASTVDPNNTAALRAVQALNQAYAQAERACKRISRLTSNVGRANLDSELGVEAADFQTKYNAIRDFANGHPGCSAPDLPS